MGGLSSNTNIANSTTITYNPQTGAAYTIQAGDSNKVVQLKNAGGCAVALPPSATIGAGFHCWVQVLNAGVNTLTPNGAEKIIVQGGTSAGVQPLTLNVLGLQTVVSWASNVHIGCDGVQWNVLEGNPIAAAILTSTVATFTDITATGAGNYNPPANCRQIIVTFKAGGSGGSGAGNGATNGAAGGDTTFNAITAKGGGATSLAGGNSGSGGNGGAGAALWRIGGQGGSNTAPGVISATNKAPAGGAGGGQGSFGGNQAGAAGGNAFANSGGGGAPGGDSGGGGVLFANTMSQGYGGAEGETVCIVINNPVGPIAYTLGAGGAGGNGGTGGAAGGNGGSGYIHIEERY